MKTERSLASSFAIRVGAFLLCALASGCSSLVSFEPDSVHFDLRPFRSVSVVAESERNLTRTQAAVGRLSRQLWARGVHVAEDGTGEVLVSVSVEEWRMLRRKVPGFTVNGSRATIYEARIRIGIRVIHVETSELLAAFHANGYDDLGPVVKFGGAVGPQSPDDFVHSTANDVIAELAERLSR